MYFIIALIPGCLIGWFLYNRFGRIKERYPEPYSLSPQEAYYEILANRFDITTIKALVCKVGEDPTLTKDLLLHIITKKRGWK